MSVFTHCSETMTDTLKTAHPLKPGPSPLKFWLPLLPLTMPHSSLTFASNTINVCPCFHAKLLIERLSLLKESLCSSVFHPWAARMSMWWPHLVNCSCYKLSWVRTLPVMFWDVQNEAGKSSWYYTSARLMGDGSGGVLYTTHNSGTKSSTILRFIHIWENNGHSWYLNSRHCF